MKQYCRMFWMLGFLFLAAWLLVGCAQKEMATDAKAKEETGWRAEAAQEDQELTDSEMDQAPGDEQEMDEFRISEEERRKARAEQEKKEKAQKALDQELKQKLQERIHFAFDSYDLSSEAREILREKAELLQKRSDLQMVIEGHCDERGTAEYNLALGERRARAAYEFLVLLGVEADRMSIISYGEERPLVEGSNEEAWAKNRRDEFRVFK